MTKIKSLRGGFDVMNNNILYIIVFIVVILLIIGASIGVYILFFKKSDDASPTPTPTPTPTDIIKNIESNLKEWGNDIDKLPIELKEAAITCYSDPQGCIF